MRVGCSVGDGGRGGWGDSILGWQGGRTWEWRNGLKGWVRLCRVLLYSQLVSWFLAASTQYWGSDDERAM